MVNTYRIARALAAMPPPRRHFRMFEDGGQPPNSSLRVPPSYFARRWSKCRRTAGQSPSVIEYCAVSVTSPVRMIRSLRMRPSNTAPSRSIAAATDG